MPKSKYKPICPYCKHENPKNKLLGSTGVINISGKEIDLTCTKCNKDFTCNCEVNICFITTKIDK